MFGTAQKIMVNPDKFNASFAIFNEN